MARAIELSVENVRSRQGGPFGALPASHARYAWAQSIGRDLREFISAGPPSTHRRQVSTIHSSTAK